MTSSCTTPGAACATSCRQRRPRTARSCCGGTDGTHLGHRRARYAPVPQQPRPHRHVDDDADRAARGAGLCLRRERQAPEARHRGPGPRRPRRARPRNDVGRRLGAHTIDTVSYADPGPALTDLRNGHVNGVLTIPPDFSRRVLARNDPRLALIEDNTDNFVSVALAATLGNMLASYSPSVKLEARV